MLVEGSFHRSSLHCTASTGILPFWAATLIACAPCLACPGLSLLGLHRNLTLISAIWKWSLDIEKPNMSWALQITVRICTLHCWTRATRALLLSVVWMLLWKFLPDSAWRFIASRLCSGRAAWVSLATCCNTRHSDRGCSPQSIFTEVCQRRAHLSYCWAVQLPDTVAIPHVRSGWHSGFWMALTEPIPELKQPADICRAAFLVRPGRRVLRIITNAATAGFRLQYSGGRERRGVTPLHARPLRGVGRLEEGLHPWKPALAELLLVQAFPSHLQTGLWAGSPGQRAA